MRTTAVYGNGKFGLADRDRTCMREELSAPYQAELLTVYLIRCFTHDLVEHVARRRNPTTFVPLDRETRRYLGIGNSTGLGMAPFLYHHPILIHQWITAMETALAIVRGVEQISQAHQSGFRDLLARARVLSQQWNVADERQTQRILQLRGDLEALEQQLANPEWLAGQQPWNTIYRWAEAHASTEGRELIASLLIEMHPEKVDDLETTMATTDKMVINADMTTGELAKLLETHYGWALKIDFDDRRQTHFFWYASEEKLEPRIGERYHEPGADREHMLTAARDAAALYADLQSSEATEKLAMFLVAHPHHRHVVRRTQTLANYPYGEIQENLLGDDLMPLDMLRFKLSVFGATKFDPKSDKWTRITLYQGAPLPDELVEADSDAWMLLPCAPHVEESAA